VGRRRRPHLDPLAARRLIVADGLQPTAEHATRVRTRFQAALAAGPTDGGRADDEQTLRDLAEAAVTRVAEVMYGSNAVFLLELDAPDAEQAGERLRAIYKPVRGERPLWDFPRHTLHLREVATYLADAALEFGHVPPTVLRDGPLGPGSVQQYVQRAAPRSADDDAEALEHQLREVAALDVLVNNADRKRAHLLVTDGPRVRAIDNALTFLPYPRQRTALIALGGTPLPKDTAARLRSLAGDARRLEALRARLARLLSTIEVDAFMHRVRELAGDPTYPELDDWDGRPFEWW
jgi:uncharacterized repeat protein (TIGR03843 family)